MIVTVAVAPVDAACNWTVPALAPLLRVIVKRSGRLGPVTPVVLPCNAVENAVATPGEIVLEPVVRSAHIS